MDDSKAWSAATLCRLFAFVDVECRCQVLAYVCSRWRKYCRHPSLWRCLDFTAAPGLRHAARALIKKHADHVGEIDLGRASLDDTLVRYLCRCAKLERLTIRTGLTDARLAKLCANLAGGIESISLTGPRLTCSSIEGFKAFHKLTHLRLDHCRLVQTDGIVHLCACPLLESLDIESCHGISDQCFPVLANACRRISRLSLANCKSLSDATLLYISEGWPDVVSLNLCGLALTDMGLACLSKACFQLEQLELGDCDQITNNGITTFFNRPRPLLALNLCNCTQVSDDCMVALGIHCPGLTSLNLSGCVLVSDLGLQLLMHGIHAMPSLRQQLPPGFDQGVLGEGCLRIRHLNLSGCVRATVIGLMAVCQLELAELKLPSNADFPDGCDALARFREMKQELQQEQEAHTTHEDEGQGQARTSDDADHDTEMADVAPEDHVHKFEQLSIKRRKAKLIVESDSEDSSS